jgi:hypothetical protein
MEQATSNKSVSAVAATSNLLPRLRHLRPGESETPRTNRHTNQTSKTNNKSQASHCSRSHIQSAATTIVPLTICRKPNHEFEPTCKPPNKTSGTSNKSVSAVAATSILLAQLRHTYSLQKAKPQEATGKQTKMGGTRVEQAKQATRQLSAVAATYKK